MKVNALRTMSNKGLSVSFSHPLMLETPDYRRGALLDMTCESSPARIAFLTKEKAFGTHSEWLLLNLGNSSGLRENKVAELLSTAYVLPGSSVVLAQILEEEGMVEYYDVYRTSMDADMKFLFLARQPVSKFARLPAKEKRINFDGVTFRAGAVILYPYLFGGFTEEGISNNPETDSYAKIGFVVERNMGQQYNFSFTLRIYDQYGYFKNGSFSHLVKYVMNEDLDFAGGVMIREDRMKYLDFAGNLLQISSPLIFKQPSLPSVSNIFLLPFEKSVWMTSGSVVIICTLLLFVELLITSQLLNLTRYSFLDVLMATIEEVCQQGSTLELKSAAAKLTSLLLSIVSFFLFIAYSAKIVALLQSSTSTIKTLPQLTNSPMAIGVQDLLYNAVYFHETIDKDVKEFYKKKIYPSGKNAYIPATEGIKKIRSGFYAYKLETNWAYKLISETFSENEKCGLTEMGVFVLPMLSVGLPKKSGLKEHFSRSMIWQREIGIYQRAMLMLSPQKPTCNTNAVGFTKVYLADIQSAVFIFVCGVTISIIVLLLESMTKLKSFLSLQKNCYLKCSK